MTVKRLLETLRKEMDRDPSIADLEVATCLATPPNFDDANRVGRAHYWDVYDVADTGERRLVIVSQPIGWRFGRPDSPAAIRAAQGEG